VNPKTKVETPASFQEMLLQLERFWSEQGCVLVQPYSSEVGAGTFNPATFLRVLGPEPWKAAYVEPSRRPKDGRYGQNPNRLQMFYQYQVVLKPAPADVLEVYLESLRHIGIDLERHDVRFVEDDWESPTLGAWGLGWEVWLDGQEITQFTYFQQAGGIELAPIAAELTYGLERIAMVLQRTDNVFDMEWAPGVTYGEVRHREEVEQSKYVLRPGGSAADFGTFHRDLFERYYQLSSALLNAGLVWPALEHCLKCSHLFNILDSSNSIGVTERTAFILRIRQLAVGIARAYVEGAAASAEQGAIAGAAT